MPEVALALLGGLAYRFRGGLFPQLSLPHTVRRLAFILALGASLYVSTGLWWAWLLALAAYPGVAMGHGSYQDLGRGLQPDNEFIRPLVRFISPWPEGSPGYDAIGLALTGLAASAPLAALHWWFGLVGLAKLPMYALGWIIPSKLPQLRRGPELGEFLFGAAFCAE